MSFENFGGRELFGTEAFDDFLDRKILECIHGQRRE
jgi:hypothetical protein